VKTDLFCDVTPCSLVDRYQTFRATHWLHLHGSRGNGDYKTVYFSTLKTRKTRLPRIIYTHSPYDTASYPTDQISNLIMCLLQRHMTPLILNLITRLRRVATFTCRLLYWRGKNPLWPLGKRVDGPNSQSGSFEKNKNPLLLPGIKTRTLFCPVRYQVTTPTAAVFYRANLTNGEVCIVYWRHCVNNRYKEIPGTSKNWWNLEPSSHWRVKKTIAGHHCHLSCFSRHWCI
jgi:hypothetical protein